MIVLKRSIESKIVSLSEMKDGQLAEVLTLGGMPSGTVVQYVAPINKGDKYRWIEIGEWADQAFVAEHKNDVCGNVRILEENECFVVSDNQKDD